MSSTPVPEVRSEAGQTTGLSAGGVTHAAWNDDELVDPHHNSEKADKVRKMFGAIAGSYDFNNRLHSLWQDVRWRRFAVKMAQVRAGESVCDVACGTGDLTQEFARTNATRVVGVDFTPAMLDGARKKQSALPDAIRSKITYQEGDAQRLPFPPSSFDVVSIAFGIRNVADPALALREFARTLRPGGRLVVLEFERPKNSIIRWLSDTYCGQIMPRTATAISGDKSGAYKYLPKSVASFATRAELSKTVRESGFDEPTTWSLSLGVCVCYRAYKVR